MLTELDSVESKHIIIALNKYYNNNDEWCSVCDSIVEKLQKLVEKEEK